MNSCGGYSVPVISSLCALSVVVILIVSGNFSASVISFSALKSGNSIPSSVELRSTFPITDPQMRAVRFSRSGDSLSVNRFTVPKKSKALSTTEELQQELARARASIRKAAGNLSSIIVNNKDDYISMKLFRNPGAFYQSYREMERRFKVYVYKEGDPPMIHDGPCKEMYSIEGRFIQEMEHGSVGSKKFRTYDPHRAHVFFLPFSVTKMIQYLYKPDSYDVTPLQKFVGDYVKVLSTKYPYWNRTNGADHLMLACHDYGPHTTKGNAQLYNISIRALCNANTSEGFNPQKDVSLPEIHLVGGQVPKKLLFPPPLNASRPDLAFFAGGLHGPIRPILIEHWKGRDKDMKVYEYLPKHIDYYSSMLQAKFCLCPSGYEVASPRVIEAIYAECIPVILSEGYTLPLSDVLRWEAFSVQVDVSQIPKLKELLMAIPEEKYRELKENLKAVRKHFVVNQPAKSFDAFHMILHSVWLRRINIRL